MNVVAHTPTGNRRPCIPARPFARRRPRIGLALVLIATAGCRETGPTAVAFENGMWFDGVGFVHGTRYAVGGVLSERAPANTAVTIDLEGRHVVPPYGEAHTHILEPGKIDAYIQYYLTRGVFYVREQAGLPSVRRRIEDALDSGVGFDFISANQGFTGPGGHPLQILEQVQSLGMLPPLAPDEVGTFVIENEAQLEAAWPEYLRDRPDFVKIFLHYSEAHEARSGDSTYLYRRGLDPALAASIVDRARAAGLQVSAHAFTAFDVRTALEAGVDHLAHFPGLGFDPELGEEHFLLTDADARLAAERGVTVTTTMSDMLGDDPESIPEERLAYVDRVIRPNLSRLREAGVPILIGTDRPRLTTDSEVAVLSALDLLDNLSLLRAWSIETPRSVFPDRRIGGLGEGFEASFLVLDGDPLEDFANTQRIALRVKEGRPIFPREMEFGPPGSAGSP
ncbi:MAG: amidohydrolase family protein [Gemmatimonadetes bacterium]|nr:amidohydrolase family protein [Gemmatimonadota bacterium]